MRSLFGRMSTKNATAGASPNSPTVSDSVASSAVIDISTFAWGAVKFLADPGVVTVYTRMDKDDAFAIAKDKDGSDMVFSPGTSPVPLPEDMFVYNEVKFESANDVTGTALVCRLSLKS